MTAISQRIPNFSHGISQQPDYLKRPGQVREAVNCLPDVTQGLLKRPGGRRVNNLHTTSGGKWFTIYRDVEEQYVVQYKDGLFKVWSLLDGLPRAVAYSDKPDSSYKKEPTDPIKTPNPGLISCDINALNASYQALRVAEQALRAKEDVIDKWYTANSPSNAIRRYISYSEPNRYGFRTVSLGHIVVKKGLLLVRDGEKIDVGKPTQPTITADEKVSVGNKVLSNVKLYIEGVVTIPGGHIVADVYEYTVRPIPKDVDKTELNRLLSELAVLKDAYNTAKETAEMKSVACGITELPSSTFNTAATVPDYLKDAEPEDIEVLTVNDYTFVTNKQRKVIMGKDSSSLRPNEAFIDIRTISYGTEYRVDFAWDDDQTVTKENVVTKLSVKPANWQDREDDKVKYTDTKIFDEANGLRFQLETRGQQTPISSTDASKGYKSVYNTYVTLLNGGTGYSIGDKITVQMRNKDYIVTVEEIKVRDAYMSAGSGKTLSTQNTSSGTISGHDLATALATDIKANTTGIETKVIGSGIYCWSPKPFTVTTGSEAYLNAFTDSVNDISRLPLQCKDGYLVKVVNSGEKEDDYYVRFVGKEGNDGTGVWEETIKPGIETTFEPASMPHQLKRQSDGSFLFSPIDWEMRLVGDNTSNPKPSFVEKPINKMFFFRNRLGFLSDENCILSRAGDYFNFWNKTALTVQPSDPVDISASSTFPAVLTDAVGYMQGVVLFSPTQQFFLTTDQDVLGPETAKMIILSTFRYSVGIPPFTLGTTLGFVNKAGKYSRFMEMVGISRDRPPELIEQSKIVSELLPNTINVVGESRENDIVMFGTKGATTVYGYRYFNDGEKRIQSSWFQWELQGRLQHHAALEDSYYTVTEHTTINGPKIWLMRYDLQPSKKTAYIRDEELLEYPVSLDNYVVATITDRQWYPHLNQTYFYLPWSHDPNTTVVAFDIGDSQYQGRMTYPTIETDSLGTWCVLEGDWSDNKIVLGLDYEMKIVLPHLYITKDEPTSNKVVADTRSSLIISRVKFNFGESGTFNTTIKRRGREDYNQLWETRPSDYYDADTHSVAPERGLTVPIYDRNTNVLIELRSSHPTPATLFSMDWEGNYSPMYYRSV